MKRSKYDRISLGATTNGHCRVTAECRGKLYRATVTDMPDIDLYMSRRRGWKSAGNRIYDRVMTSKLRTEIC